MQFTLSSAAVSASMFCALIPLANATSNYGSPARINRILGRVRTQGHDIQWSPQSNSGVWKTLFSTDHVTKSNPKSNKLVVSTTKPTEVPGCWGCGSQTINVTTTYTIDFKDEQTCLIYHEYVIKMMPKVQRQAPPRRKKRSRQQIKTENDSRYYRKAYANRMATTMKNLQDAIDTINSAGTKEEAEKIITEKYAKQIAEKNIDLKKKVYCKGLDITEESIWDQLFMTFNNINVLDREDRVEEEEPEVKRKVHQALIRLQRAIDNIKTKTSPGHSDTINQEDDILVSRGHAMDPADGAPTSVAKASSTDGEGGPSQESETDPLHQLTSETVDQMQSEA